jgi:hypothetical protein
MKNIVRLGTFLLLALLGLSEYSMAQPLVKAEYFFVSDPGVGNATALAITPTYNLNLNTGISSTGLGIGPHQLFIRVLQDSSNGKAWWSLAESRWFTVLPVPTFPNYQISRGEYFFDIDPGVGKGTSFVTGTVDSVLTNTSISTSSLGTGTHNLYWRFKNTNGVWGNFEARSFYIFNVSPTVSKKLVYGEYFIDSDPGMGKANPLAISNVDSLKTNFAISLSGVTNGVHEVTIRLRDSIGKWTMAESRFFNVFPPAEKTSPLASFEIFFDSDPGVGKGFQLQSLGNKDSVNINAVALANGLTNGNHTAMIRAKDSLGRYSLVDVKKFYVCTVFPVADFKADYFSYDSTVNFTNQTTGSDANTTYKWDLNGDGTNDNTFLNPQYKYSTPGIYKVRLITSNGGVCADTIIKNVIATNDTC